ncbi:MAG: hypothetical protein LBL52_03315 [Rickettsiales bacterium]|jgi:hypothetical protein|nr:hypothetical protein [Rickettsiales bacterium]
MKRFLFVILLLPVAARANVLTDALSSALAKYCIPREDSDCSVEFAAVYDEAYAVQDGSPSNKCKCPSDNMAYNMTTRRCEYCIYGSGGRYATACNGTPACPVGYTLQQVPSNTNSCGAGEYYQIID